MTLLAYLLKVIVVSAILYGYYRLFLRNKRFHHYNRFFLLSALLLSIVLPFIRIPLLYQPENPVNEAVYRTVSVINTDYGDDIPASASVPVNEPVFTLMNSIYLVYAIGVLFLLTLVFKSLLYIRGLRKRYQAEKITNLRFYNTQEPGTPFSFFRSIFWNHQLNFNSHEGQQIFRHELFHVQHQHSADRLLSELLTALFWFNPFFHLIKKELKAIHEFLADQFAISDSDRYAYATLLVQQALESGKHAVTNHFFQNHIKRRIAMITQFQQSKYGYWSRVMILPVAILLFCFITLYAKKPAVAAENTSAALLGGSGNGDKTAFNVLQGQPQPKEQSPARKVKDTVPGLSEKETELLRMRQAQIEELRKKMMEQEETIKNSHRNELESLRQQMMEHELMVREQEQNRKILRDEAMLLKRKMLNRQNQINNEMKEQTERMQRLIKENELKAKENPAAQKENEAKLEQMKKEIDVMQQRMQNQQRAEEQEIKTRMRELELKSQQQGKEMDSRRVNLRNMKERVMERESEIRKLQQEEMQQFRKELERQKEEIKNKEQEIKRRREKEQQGGQSSLQLQGKPLQGDDSLVKKVIRHYLRDMRYPELAIQNNVQGSIYFSIVVDKNGVFKDFVTYDKAPSIVPVKDLVIVTYKTPLAVHEQAIDASQKEEILKAELKRVTDRSIQKPVIHPMDRRYYFRAVFQMQERKEDNKFLLSSESNRDFKPLVTQVSNQYNWSQDTIPAKAARKAKIAKPGEHRVKEIKKPRAANKALKKPGEPKELKTQNLQHKRKPEAARQKMMLARKAERAKEARKEANKERKIRAKARKNDGSGPVRDDEENEENYSEISVTGDK